MGPSVSLTSRFSSPEAVACHQLLLRHLDASCDRNRFISISRRCTLLTLLIVQLIVSIHLASSHMRGKQCHLLQIGRLPGNCNEIASRITLWAMSGSFTPCEFRSRAVQLRSIGYRVTFEFDYVFWNYYLKRILVMLTSVARLQYPVDLWEKEICEVELKLLQLQFHLKFHLVPQFDRC